MFPSAPLIMLVVYNTDSLSRLISLGKVARHSFQLTGTVPSVAHAGDIFYLLGLAVGIVMWGFALVWFIVAIIMIATAAPFPFNMGWWGFVFPVGKQSHNIA
jgi:tellurite resistance protein TehA-like permease